MCLLILTQREGLRYVSLFTRLTTQTMMNALTVPVPHTKSITLNASRVDDDFQLWIAEPQTGFATNRAEPPVVLYLLDANLYFGTATEMTRLMHVLFGELPQIRVVGIAYPTGDGFRQSQLRARDFTPTEDAGLPSPPPNPAAPPPVEPAMGGADRFLDFLRNEVRPWVDENLPVTPAASLLFGSSLGGLFTTYAFTHAPTAFDHFVAVSPALWWDSGVAMQPEPLTHAVESSTSSLHVLVGEHEENPAIPMLASFKMISNAKQMMAPLMEADPDRFHFEVIAGETHTSVVAPALSRGLRRAIGQSRGGPRPG